MNACALCRDECGYLGDATACPRVEFYESEAADRLYASLEDG